MMLIFRNAVAAIILGLAMSTSYATVSLPALFSEHAVLQRSAKLPIYGTAAPSEVVKVTLGSVNASAIAGPDGKWKVLLDVTRDPGTPGTLKVDGKNHLAVEDVIVGDVWVASGQSNMEFVLKRVVDADKVIAESTNPMLREFRVAKNISAKPTDEYSGEWRVAGPATTAGFSAVAYFFGLTLQRELKMPVGIIHASWFGTPAEAWISGPAMDQVRKLKAAEEIALKTLSDHDQTKQAYAKIVADWLTTNQRNDRPVTDAAAWSTGSTAGWKEVKVPGDIRWQDFSGLGAVWLRTKVNISAEGGALTVDLGKLRGAETVYWNGEKIAATSFTDGEGEDGTHKAVVPQNLIKQGENELAVRVFAPVMPARLGSAIGFSYEDKAQVLSPWQAKPEYMLPALDVAALGAAPKPPAAIQRIQNTPTVLYNAMIYPLLNYGIRGVIWYQGESNTANPADYSTIFPLLIKSWRTAWNQGDFPFYFCQLGNFLDKRAMPDESKWAELREAQTEALSLPNTGQAVLIDLGDTKDVHFINKRPAGERLAAIALANTYGRKVPFSGPTLESVKREGDKLRLFFANLEGGLVAQPVKATYPVNSRYNMTAPFQRNSPESELEGFTLRGPTGKWFWADAKIDGDTVVVWSKDVPNPEVVRYDWADNPSGNLYNKAGFPAGPLSASKNKSK